MAEDSQSTKIFNSSW